MNYSLSHLSDGALLRDLAALVSRDRATTAALLAHLAEVDTRKLYLPAAYPSMYLYCVHELHLSEDAAFKRINAARVARRYPAIFEALADGRLHLSAVNVLAPYLGPATADELLAAAAHKTRAEIEQMLAERFPRTDTLPLVTESAAGSVAQLAPGRVNESEQATEPASERGDVMGVSCQLAPGRVGTARVAPLSSRSVELQVTLERETYDLLKYAQRLMSHRAASGDVPQVLHKALQSLVRDLEKQKFAATERPRPMRRQPAPGERFLPAEVKRAVWARDGGQCTFVTSGGQRCPSRTRLEFDHVQEVARGGVATVNGMRLRCRAHNQYTAEQTFGAGFIERKRHEGTVGRRGAAGYPVAEESEREQPDTDPVSEVPILRQLGIRGEDARRAAAACACEPGAPIEQRVRLALRSYGARIATTVPAHTG